MWSVRTNLAQRGDTIVEVLVVIAVLGFAFSISYATANRSMRQARNAQEHAQALGVANSQMEQVKNILSTDGSSNPILFGTDPFCITATAPTKTLASCVQSPGQVDYSPVIKYTSDILGDGGYYTFEVTWDGQGGLSTDGKQRELLYYRVHKL